MKFYFFFLAIIVCTVSKPQAQSSKELEDAYTSNIPLHQEIVSGGYYVDPPQNIEGFAYFRSRNFEYGSLTINGLTYENVPLLYNIFSDEVVTFHPVHKQKTLIKTEKIDGFLLLESIRFIRIKENPEYSHHGKGFYELVEEGEEANLLCKHFKTTKAKREMTQYSSIFLEKSDYLIQKGNQIMLVKNKGQAIDFLSLEKKQINRSTKENGLNYRNDRRAYLSYLVEFYNQSAHE
ncbi:hypothetical protein MMU07_00465 [Aquiflexum sp. LQ15W]|uniref:hypothetical protein n=1 Tax=Cognataquiflexum nitidum TaxID=2922272 RepID=UPI001F141C1E|nr:hypothetical protein [Cognataquiflexum nitidum]MCH6198033.1 hypothetical protein [Cognataquiflexum nitidum]